MVNIRLKVGPKGQIVIPKVFREAYGIKEGGEVIVEPGEKGLLIRGPIKGEELIRKIREERKKINAKKKPKPGELKGISLEDEFDETWGIGG